MRKIVIVGAAGRDFHDFNMRYRESEDERVVAFTAAQIPGIEDRVYPSELAGAKYPEGIPIRSESCLEEICRAEAVDEVVFAYSDVLHADVMHLASRALASGAAARLPGPNETMLRSERPVIAVSAVRTGCGKSQTARWIAKRVSAAGHRVAAIRHPMPYGDLAQQRAQRFACEADLVAAACTIEEREEYEPWVALGIPIHAGVDYAEVLRAAEKEADWIVWDGGNNDLPFVRPGLHVVLADALRPGHVRTHHPGEAVARMADVFVIAKSDMATAESIGDLEDDLRALAPEVPIVRGASPVTLDAPELVRGRRVVVVDDGPTLTHGGMAYGAGYVAAVQAGAAEIVDPWPAAADSLQETRQRYPHLHRVLPAMGYSARQCEDLRDTLDRSEADVIVAGTPVDLQQLLHPKLPVVRASYGYAEASRPGLGEIIDAFLAAAKAPRE
jgi:predicted GTPase